MRKHKILNESQNRHRRREIESEDSKHTCLAHVKQINKLINSINSASFCEPFCQFSSSIWGLCLRNGEKKEKRNVHFNRLTWVIQNLCMCRCVRFSPLLGLSSAILLQFVPVIVFFFISMKLETEIPYLNGYANCLMYNFNRLHLLALLHLSACQC